MLGNEKLKELAAQLKQPQGTEGVEISNVMNETNAKMTFHSVDRLNLLNGNITLELGHGNCQHLSYLLNLKNNLIYYGLELSELMIEEAQRINKEFIVAGRAFFYLYNGENIPFADNFFDRIFTVNTIYFWNNPGMLLFELYRVIKPDGILNITFEQKSFMEQLPYAKFGFELYDDEKMTKLVATTPFEIIASDTQTEIAKNEIGDLVNKLYTTFTLKK